MTDRPDAAHRCQVIVPSGLEAPRTYRCWFPLPCDRHDTPRAAPERVTQPLSGTMPT